MSVRWSAVIQTLVAAASTHAARLWLASSLLLAGMGQTSGAESVRPNVVLILADDLGWSDLGCYGADLHETPHLDQLASGGVRFTNAYAAPVCSPTRSSLMTGKHYARLHVTTWYESAANPPRDRPLVPPLSIRDLPLTGTTIAKRLQAAGYLTALVGKWHLGDAAHYPEAHGFDINVGGTFWGAPFSYFFPYRGAGRYGGEFRYVPHLEGGQPGEYLTDRLTDEALRVIDSAGERPFFLYLAHHAVHTPIEPKPELTAHYEAKIAPGLYHQNANYAAMVQSLDESVGRVMQRIEERGLSDRTVIIFLSDNGGHIGEFDNAACTNNAPLRSGKGSLYEGGVRVPLIVRWPAGAAQNQACDAPVHCVDIAPTIAAITGLADEAHADTTDGRTLAALLQDPTAPDAAPPIFHHYPHYYPTSTPASAVRVGDWKLIEFLEDGRREFYNLADDVSESHDLANVEREKTAELGRTLDAWRKQVDAQMPSRNASFRAGIDGQK
jgi:arylsulfatase A-like enzyme